MFDVVTETVPEEPSDFQIDVNVKLQIPLRVQPNENADANPESGS
jgi:hypothetical protein